MTIKDLRKVADFTIWTLHSPSIVPLKTEYLEDMLSIYNAHFRHDLAKDLQPLMQETVQRIEKELKRRMNEKLTSVNLN